MVCVGIGVLGLWEIILRRSSEWCAACVRDVFGRGSLRAGQCRGALVPTLMVCVGLISFSALLGARLALHETSEQLLEALLDLGVVLAGLAFSFVILLLAVPHAASGRLSHAALRFPNDPELYKPLSDQLVLFSRIVAVLCGVGATGVLLAWSILQVALIDDARE